MTIRTQQRNIVLLEAVALCTLMLAFLCAPLYFVSAKTTVENNISVSSKSGGNSASQGSVVEGSAKTTVFFETTVDGERVEYINETIEDDEEPIVIEKTYEDENVSVKTSIYGGTSESTDTPPRAETTPLHTSFAVPDPSEGDLMPQNDQIDTTTSSEMSGMADDSLAVHTKETDTEERSFFTELINTFIAYVFSIFSA